MRVGRDLRTVRRQRGLTLEELSERCGVSRDDLGLYERGEMTPRPGTVARIAAALDVPMERISQGMGWTELEGAERWEVRDGTPLRDAVVEAVRDRLGTGPRLEEGDLQALMASVKASIPALAERLKDTRPEGEIVRELLRELDGPAAQEPPDAAALTDGQWEVLAPLLPPENGGRGRAFKSNRLMLEGIVYHLRTGTAWKDLPERFGRYRCVSGRLRLWQETGVWPPLEEALRALGLLDGPAGDGHRDTTG